ncbi:FAD-binding oxidoreductase [Sphingomonas sp. SUN019]|uniref:FAD-binding oxidoreductase n=1 Tax=Sphingomonas sp. SUN019 TaxID=2937788 RepID=UPI0021647FC2|nr:FAD-binding oxidoreductase [Sphingomonas sp. SUN019]UVO50504.1 FAD-binding oxidoreductase [Sphingomonas sp. SUN019]
MSTSATAAPPVTGDISSDLIALLGPGRVETDLDKRTFFSTDMSRRGPAAAAVIRPDDAGQVAAAVKLCTTRGVVVIPRGGGFSYTGGYVPTQDDSVIVDLRGLDRIVEINADDMYVVVETGVTWRELYEALKEKGLRTPYFGPMSGYHATVGGAVSQGSFFLGSSQYGPVADSVLAIEVALADGTLLRTGSWGGAGDASPFFRSYGPDLTGLFLGDTGAFGFKTKAVLKLIPFPAHQGFASFAFTDEATAAAAVSAIARTGIAAECYLWDPYFVKVMASATTGLAEDLKFLAGVLRGGGSKTRGLFNAAKVAVAGKSVFDGDVFMLNLTVDDATRTGADARIALLKQIAADGGGREMPASAPMAMRGTPFTDFNTPERRRPLRNLPTHGLVPHSHLPALSREVRALLDDRRPAMQALGVEVGVIYFGVGVQAACLEPVFYWDDDQHFHHDRVAERTDLTGLGDSTTPDATTLVMDIRKELVEIFTRHGSAHVQIGKSYPWLATRSEPVAQMIAAMKTTLDPNARVNPGSLGLSTPG